MNENELHVFSVGQFRIFLFCRTELDPKEHLFSKMDLLSVLWPNACITVVNDLNRLKRKTYLLGLTTLFVVPGSVLGLAFWDDI